MGQKRLNSNTLFWKKIKQNVDTYLIESSLHGLRYISSSTKSLCVRAIWFLIVCFGFTISAILIMSSKRTWSENQVSTMVSLEDYENFPFPEVTICFHFSQKWRPIERVLGEILDPDGQDVIKLYQSSLELRENLKLAVTNFGLFQVYDRYATRTQSSSEQFYFGDLEEFHRCSSNGTEDLDEEKKTFLRFVFSQNVTITKNNHGNVDGLYEALSLARDVVLNQSLLRAMEEYSDPNKAVNMANSISLEQICQVLKNFPLQDRQTLLVFWEEYLTYKNILSHFDLLTLIIRLLTDPINTELHDAQWRKTPQMMAKIYDYIVQMSKKKSKELFDLPLPVALDLFRELNEDQTYEGIGLEDHLNDRVFDPEYWWNYAPDQYRHMYEKFSSCFAKTRQVPLVFCQNLNISARSESSRFIIDILSQVHTKAPKGQNPALALCMFDGDVNHSFCKDFTRATEFCYSYNTRHGPDQKDYYVTGLNNGDGLSLKIDFPYGGKIENIIMHARERGSFPDINAQAGVNLPVYSGRHTKFGVTGIKTTSTELFRNMNVKDRECLLPFETYETEMPNILGNYYNKITCRYAHIIDKMIDYCQCTPWFIATNDAKNVSLFNEDKVLDKKYPICEGSHKACLVNMFRVIGQEFKKNQHEKCPQSCDGIYYDIQIQDSDKFWQNFDTMESLKASANYKDVFSEENRKRFATFVQPSRNVLEYYKERFEKIAFIHVNFDRPLMTVITKDQRMSWTEKISDVGGTLGLFTGFSILSLFELFYWIWRTIA